MTDEPVIEEAANELAEGKSSEELLKVVSERMGEKTDKGERAYFADPKHRLIKYQAPRLGQRESRHRRLRAFDCETDERPGRHAAVRFRVAA